MKLLYTAIFVTTLYLMPVQATAQEQSCSASDRHCLLILLENEARNIKDKRWRDQTYRELAKLLTTDKQNTKAISLIDKIKNPDTKAMTIRGIGMAAADINLSKQDYDSLFTALAIEADKIEHAPSHAIAQTYIAMAQAFAGDDDGAMATALKMENDSLRYKALGETAEIQAEHGDLIAAQASLAAIDSFSYSNKAHLSVAKIFTRFGKHEEALQITTKIKNNYQKAQAILYIMIQQDRQKLANE